MAPDHEPVEPERFDALILGSGQGGNRLAWHLGRSGRRVAVVERRWIGGSCPNIACLPSKNEIWGAKVAHLVRHAADFGITVGPATVDMAAVRQRKREMVAHDVAGILRLFEETGVALVSGHGRMVGSRTIEVRADDGGTRILVGDQVFINVGSRATIPDIPGLVDARPLTHVEVLELDVVPRHLIVIGGGYVGLEMAQAFARFGSRVTILQSGAQLVSGEDADIAAAIRELLEAEGIAILTNAQTLRVTGRSGEMVSLDVQTQSEEQTIEGSHILVAAGRSPNSTEIGLAEAGIELDERGYVRVNERLETSAPGVWALGECAGSPKFTHASNDDFRVIRDNLAGADRTTAHRLVPYCMFTDPPLAHVGLSEDEARRRGIAVRVGRLLMRSVLRALTTDETQGFMKVLVAADSDEILGFTMIGAEAGEVVAAVQMAMLAKLPFQRLRDAVLAHPTMAEGLSSLLETIAK